MVNYCRQLQRASTRVSNNSGSVAINMATKSDVAMIDATAKPQDTNDHVDLLQTNHSDAFAFSKSERLVLQLYDQLRELELEQSLLQAQQSSLLPPCDLLLIRLIFFAAHVTDISGLSSHELQAQLTVAQREAMEAKAEYELRNKITHNVLVMDPVLKAVHGGERTGQSEK
jgi:hypothetical protein